MVDQRTREAIRESLRTYGAIDPITVRSDPDNPGEWLIIDGEHRHEILVEEGHEEADVIPLDIDENGARKLTIILNETRGQADTVPLARLLAELQQSTTLEELMIGLPYDRGQLDELLKIGQIDWDTFHADRASEAEENLRLRSGKNQFTVFLNFDKAQKEKYDTYTGMLAREKGDDYTVERAVIDGLSLICKQL